ncbi:MAG: LPXTG cell wall anchor domain-containing protein [Acidimicrobiia bacterium]
MAKILMFNNIRAKFTTFLVITIFGAMLLSNGSAFAASQSVDATGAFRNYTNEESTELHPMRDSPTDLIGNPANPSSNPQNATNSSPGWTPDGTTTQIPTVPSSFSPSEYTSIILDLPKVNLSCSSDVKISVTSGSADLLTAQTNSANYGWIVVNNLNRAIGFNGDYVQFEGNTSDNTPGSRSLVGEHSLNPSSTAFGLKLIVSVQIYNNDGSQVNTWDIHDLAVSYIYDNENGNCNSSNAPASVPCSDEYLDTQGVDLNAQDLSDLGQLSNTESFINVDGDPNLVLSDTGLAINPNLNESGTQGIFRVFELKFTPQTPLLGAGDVELSVSYDIDLGPNGGQTLISIGNLTTQYDWQQFNFAIFDGTESAYLPSAELNQAHIYFMTTTFSTPDEQAGLTLSNLSVTVRHLRDVAVCGVSATRGLENGGSTPTPTIPGGVTGRVNGIGSNSTLPDTGASSLFLLISALLMIGIGGAFTKFSKLKTNS